MALQSVDPKELEWGQIVIVQLDHYKVIGTFKRKGGGWNVRTVSRHNVLTNFQFEDGERIMAVVTTPVSFSEKRRPMIPNKTRRY